MIAAELQDDLAPFNRLPGDEDHAWYWAALLLLDNRSTPDSLRAWLEQTSIQNLRSHTTEAGTHSEHEGWQRHLALAKE